MQAIWEKHADGKLAVLVEEIIKNVELPAPFAGATSRSDLEALKKAGSELWLDTGDRDAAEKNWHSELTGLTTNNTLANQVVQKGIYDSAIEKAVAALRDGAPSLSDEDLVIEVGFIVNSVIAKSLVARFGVNVSVEPHPALAHDIEATVMFGKRYFNVAPDDFFVKAPLTPAGVIAVRRLIEAGVKINFTLGFSARQNHLLARISKPTYLNVFLGRDNQVVIENKLGDGANVGEKATLAAQKDVAQARRDGLSDTKLIAASIRSADQIVTLAGVDVLTIPPGAIEKFYAMNLSPADIAPELDLDLPVKTTGDGVDVLWEISDNFRRMTESLAKEDVSAMTSKQLTDFIRDAGVDDLFGDFSDSDTATMKAKGKIPDLSQWKGRGLALDDLLTNSALLAFAKDQEALDARIAGFVKK